jgi:Undecaprenyl-phosphate galactose phosphotransferase WbaP
LSINYADRNIASAASSGRRAPHPGPLLWRDSWSIISRFWLVLADVAALALSFSAIVVLRSLMFEGNLPPLHFGLSLAVIAWFVFRWASGRYSFGQLAPEELRYSFMASLIAGLIHLAVLIADEDLAAYRLITLFIWPAVLPFTYSFREIVRHRLIAKGRYGVPIVVVGNGVAARRALRELQAQAALGYHPVAMFSTERAQPEELRQMVGIPMIGRSGEAATYGFPYQVRHALLAVGEGWQDERNHHLAAQLGRCFKHLQVFTNLTGVGNWVTQARPLGPYMTVHTRNVRLTVHQRLLKRAMDVAISLPALVVTSPFILLAGLAIKISDPGPIFFSQTREGRGGKPIKIWKLRSMVQGAEAKLAKHLAENPEARFEYERTMKLRDDPRILPVVGKLIRKTSVDELPQLLTILKGDMSLVGPRVMPTREVDLYSQEGRDMRRDMPPGLTGFWQVEHRNDSDFQIREVADSFYVANWSVWMDLWIILRTVRVVLSGAGAF